MTTCKYCGQAFVRINSHYPHCFMMRRQDTEKSIKRKRDEFENTSNKILKIKDDIIDEQKEQIGRLKKMLADKPTTIYNVCVEQRLISDYVSKFSQFKSEMVTFVRGIANNYQGIDGARKLIVDCRDAASKSTNPDHKMIVELLSEDFIDEKIPLDIGIDKDIVLDKIDDHLNDIEGSTIIEICNTVGLGEQEKKQLLVENGFIVGDAK
jgi:hypothetical protein